MKVVGGSGSVPLARGIAHELGVSYVEVAFEKHQGGFPDRERYVRLLGSIAGEHVVMVQTTHPDPHVVEFFLLANAIRDGGAQRLTAVVPYFGYGRQDKRFLEGEAVSAKAIGKHLATDVDDLLTMAVHNPDILKTFAIPAQDVDGIPALGRYLKGVDVDMLLAPDDNAMRFAKTASAICGKRWDHLEKERIDSHTVKITPKKLDVRDQSIAIIDDVISTGGTIRTVTKELRSQGARRVIAACVHGLFVDNAETNLKACDDVIATDTIQSLHTKVSVAPEFAAAIRSLS